MYKQHNRFGGKDTKADIARKLNDELKRLERAQIASTAVITRLISSATVSGGVSQAPSVPVVNIPSDDDLRISWLGV